MLLVQKKIKLSGEIIMSKFVYFFFQLFWSAIVASVVWFFFPKSGTFSFDLTGDYQEAGLFFIGGAVLYLIFTIVQIILGRETIKKWSKGIAIATIIIAVIVFAAGKFGAQYGTAFLSETLGVTLSILG